MAPRDDSSAQTPGPADEDFAEKERRKKLIYGSIALVGAVVTVIVILYAFGMTSAKIEVEDQKAAKEATKKTATE